MKLLNTRIILILTSALLLSCSDLDGDKPPPRITAQGFVIETVQEGLVSEFPDLRLRIESPARIENLQIKERSFEVDLATTPERGHFQLFGIKTKTLQHTDVTLDFKNYINPKLTAEGEYQFLINVKDKKGRITSTVLKVRLTSPAISKTPIEIGQFILEREGRGEVDNGEIFGIAWKTVDEINVTIRFGKAEGGASKLASFTDADFDRLESKEELSEWINVAKDLEQVEFDCSHNSARGRVLGINNLGNYYLLRILDSCSSLSEAGTKVTLNGEYKY